MVRLVISGCFVLLAVVAVGCCGPMGCGPGCNAGTGCYDCDGLAGNQLIGSPLDGMRRFKRSLVCGGGCGEAYYGEWISTPPDCQDPCCGSDWVGGAVKCRPFCWTPGTFLSGLYGTRFCSGAESSVSCGCDGGCDECGGYAGEYVDGGYYEAEYTDESYYEGVSSGCATCSSGNGVTGNARYASRPTADAATRSTRRRSDERVQSIRR